MARLCDVLPWRPLNKVWYGSVHSTLWKDGCPCQQFDIRTSWR